MGKAFIIINEVDLITPRHRKNIVDTSNFLEKISHQ